MSSRWSGCGEKGNLNKKLWTVEEDNCLLRYIKLLGCCRWDSLAKAAGLQRCGRSCRLRWVNYLRPGIKHGNITPEEERIIIDLYGRWGSRWSLIAESIPGRTDNEIKNYWRSNIKKKLQNLAQNRNLDSSNCSAKAQVQDQQLILPQERSEPFSGNAIKDYISYENTHDHVSVRMDIPMDTLRINEIFTDMEEVQVQEQVEASLLGSAETEGSIQDDKGTMGHGAIEISRAPNSFLSGIRIESYAISVHEASSFTNPELMYPTHECESNLGSNIIAWNMEPDTSFLSSNKDTTFNAIESPLLYESNHIHALGWTENPTDKLCIEEIISDMDQVQVQGEDSLVGSREEETSIQNGMGIAEHDVVEFCRTPYSIPSGISIESYGTMAFEGSCSTNIELMYPTESECDNIFGSDLFYGIWN
ncbi:hypothetical protein SUGI_0299390 [Cryptomeria japonica]|uniref:transcription repressor MYB4-like n=1 Tax=Cryptomeria japonica TaxID=3369 RepID=UPI0024089E17|nr:transcription repressor MYB4-like [Cryptomeria japonica]GLJ17256.1 hypothetical protein SUGI_0299390 [Cryptomeria japonica]